MPIVWLFIWYVYTIFIYNNGYNQAIKDSGGDLNTQLRESRDRINSSLCEMKKELDSLKSNPPEQQEGC